MVVGSGASKRVFPDRKSLKQSSKDRSATLERKTISIEFRRDLIHSQFGMLPVPFLGGFENLSLEGIF
jgi:hypothetical protein